MPDKRIIHSKYLFLTGLPLKVRERMMGSWIKDQDYLKRGFPFTVEWTNKYLEAEKFIKSFHVYLSTAPGGMSELSYIMSIKAQ